MTKGVTWSSVSVVLDKVRINRRQKIDGLETNFVAMEAIGDHQIQQGWSEQNDQWVIANMFGFINIHGCFSTCELCVIWTYLNLVS